MTRKHFESFAKMLREVPSVYLRLKMAEGIIEVLKEFNPRFNEAKFRKCSCTK